jgi:hypothetical protein
MRLVACSLSASAALAGAFVAAGAAGVLPDDATSAGCWALVVGGVVGTLLAGSVAYGFGQLNGFLRARREAADSQ